MAHLHVCTMHEFSKTRSCLTIKASERQSALSLMRIQEVQICICKIRFPFNNNKSGTEREAFYQLQGSCERRAAASLQPHLLTAADSGRLCEIKPVYSCTGPVKPEALKSHPAQSTSGKQYFPICLILRKSDIIPLKYDRALCKHEGTTLELQYDL